MITASGRLGATAVSTDDAAFAQVQLRELAVAVLEFHGNRSLDRRGRTGDLRDAVLEAGRKVDPGAMHVTGHRVPDGDGRHLDQPRDTESARPLLDVDLE